MVTYIRSFNSFYGTIITEIQFATIVHLAFQFLYGTFWFF